MLDRLTAQLQFQAQALSLRAERQKNLASNIANADTPGYQARDFDFTKALQAATGAPAAGAAAMASAGTAGADPARSAATLSLAVPGAAPSGGRLLATNQRHLGVASPDGGRTIGTGQPLQYRVPEQAAMDGNTVDLDRERANFADNAVRYEATLKFINGHVRSLMSAIRGD